MKLLTTLLFYLLFIDLCYCQYFAPLGATWHFNHATFSPEVNYNKLEVIDTNTIVNGKICSKISKQIHMCSPTFEYVYYENNIVFQYHSDSNNFDTLYNFNALQGESWSNSLHTFTVDSVVNVNINGITLKGLYVNHNTTFGPILERIGNGWSDIINDLGFCDPIDGGSLRCYSDNILGTYQKSSIECNSIYFSSINSNSTNEITIQPNPFIDYIEIKSLKGEPKFYNLIIYDNQGKVILTNRITDSRVNLKELPPGFYIIQIWNKDKLINNSKLIKKLSS